MTAGKVSGTAGSSFSSSGGVQKASGTAGSPGPGSQAQGSGWVQGSGGSQVIPWRVATVGSLCAFAVANWRQYRPARHHHLIAQALERVARGECKRLMIFMPPRHGKSMLASEYFPAWYLGRNPSHRIIACSYAQALAEDFGRKVRNIIASDIYREIFPGITLAQDSSAAARFALGTGNGWGSGGYFGVGVGGPATGRGAELLLIDDPIKGMEEAESAVQRQNLKDWYSSVARTRLQPGGAIVIIQTRWHEDDLAGWLLAEHGHEGWEVLSLPAISEQDEREPLEPAANPSSTERGGNPGSTEPAANPGSIERGGNPESPSSTERGGTVVPRPQRGLGRAEGEALWPSAYPVTELNLIRASVGERIWASLYQQRPTALEGGLIKMHWFRRYVGTVEPSDSGIYVPSGSSVPAGNTSPDVPAGTAGPEGSGASERPKFRRIVQSWDTAHKAGELNDPSVCTTWGETEAGWYLLHVLRARLEYPDLKRAVQEQARTWRPQLVLVEDKASGQSIIQDLRSGSRLPILGIMPKGDKVMRCSAITPLIEAGRVWLPSVGVPRSVIPRNPAGSQAQGSGGIQGSTFSSSGVPGGTQGASWLGDLENEILSFPNGKHDDQVDSITQALSYMSGLNASGAGIMEFYRRNALNKPKSPEPGQITVINGQWPANPAGSVVQGSGGS